MRTVNGDARASLLLTAAEQVLSGRFAAIERVAVHNQRKVLEAFWQERVAEADLHGSTGYGLGDAGRAKLERVFANLMGTETALVRPQISSGTHALRVALFGLLRPGDELLLASGAPYDTLEAVIGIRPTPGSLQEWDVGHRIVPLADDGSLDIAAIVDAVTERTKVALFQRSRGYSARPALSMAAMAKAFRTVRLHHPHVLIVVDNCYGEFVETEEPGDVGADVVVGSLIKNPGGGLVATGGYVALPHRCLDSVAAQLTASGIGAEVGATLGFLRSAWQGLFIAPHVVGQAIRGSTLAAKVFADLGFGTSPTWEDPRSDIVLSIYFGDRDRLLSFCEQVQRSAPIDSFLVPIGAAMAGYADPVVMAAGTFVQGATLELTADAPLRPPYIAYIQGGLTYEHTRITLERVMSALLT